MLEGNLKHYINYTVYVVSKQDCAGKEEPASASIRLDADAGSSLPAQSCLPKTGD